MALNFGGLHKTPLEPDYTRIEVMARIKSNFCWSIVEEVRTYYSLSKLDCEGLSRSFFLPSSFFANFK